MVIHIADIHKRNYNRHEEFSCVANKLYKSIENIISKGIKIDEIVCVGDIVDSKTILSTESISWVIDFFETLTIYSNVIVTNGNHDASLTNKDRKSALDLVYKFLKNNPNYHYFTESKIYSMNNGHYYGNFSIFDDEKKWPIEIENKDSEGIYIALYHGMLNNSKNESNYNLESSMDPNYLFKSYDITMLGDIHLRQFFNEYYIEKEIDEPEIEEYKYELGFEIIK